VSRSDLLLLLHIQDWLAPHLRNARAKLNPMTLEAINKELSHRFPNFSGFTPIVDGSAIIGHLGGREIRIEAYEIMALPGIRATADHIMRVVEEIAELERLAVLKYEICPYCGR